MQQRTETPILTNLKALHGIYGISFDLTAKSIKAICEVHFQHGEKNKLLINEYQDACTGGGKFLECVEPEQGDKRGKAWRVEGKSWLVADAVMKLHIESVALFCEQNDLLLWKY